LGSWDLLENGREGLEKEKDNVGVVERALAMREEKSREKGGRVLRKGVSVKDDNGAREGDEGRQVRDG